MSRPKNLGYSLNQKIRRIARRVMRLLTTESKEKRLDFQSEELKKILLVRATSRMGDSILATAAIPVFRQNFPNARIDFVGSRISGTLFRNCSIDNHFTITRRFPESSWAYLALIRQLRAVRYDLAVDLSCSHSAMGSFIVGFSRARFRVGLRGEWDRWFNVRIPKPPEKNKYRALPALLRAVGLPTEETLPSLVLSAAEKEDGRKRIKDLIRSDGAPIVGVFIGGRKSWGKSWPIDNFCELIRALCRHGVNVVTFVGPEETKLIRVFKNALDAGMPLVYESSSRNFAAMVSNCDLFVTCDSGPMHLASALGTRTVAIFRNNNFDRWAPPQTLARVLYQPDDCSAAEVLSACLAELADHSALVSHQRGNSPTAVL